MDLNPALSENNIKRCMNPKCNKILSNSSRSKYCSETCRTRVSALRQYNRLKDNEEFKQYRKAKNKKYYEDNKEELKAHMRVYALKYYFKKRDEKRAEKQKLEEQKNEQKPETSEQTISQTNNNQ